MKENIHRGYRIPRMNSALFLLLLTVILAPQVHAHTPEDGSIWATLGPLFNTTFETPQGADSHSQSLAGAGLIVEGDLSERGGLEISFLYLDRQYHLRNSGAMLTERVNRIHIPVGYRRWFTNKFSAGLGFYSSYRLGDVKEISRPASISSTVHTSATEKITEYGFDFSAQWEPLQKGPYAAIIDVRYSHPINEKAHESAEHYTFFAGLKYLVQKKQED